MYKNSCKLRRHQVSLILVICLLISTIISGCSSNESNRSSTEPLSKSTFLLNTIVTITIYDSNDESVLEGAFDLCKKYENIFSRTSSDSELYQLNEGSLEKKENGYEVSDELSQLIQAGLTYGKLSNGSFDIAIEPVSSLWDFTAEDPQIPDDSIIQSKLPLVNYQDVTVIGNQIKFAKEGMGLDLGAIAKGYIADQIKNYLLENDVNSAMINLGGNVLCVGTKPNGAPFNIGIQKPFADRNETVAVMELKDVSVVSSGIYERYFTKDDKFYHHILNPKTGYPYETDLVAVTIISDKSVDGDGLSTSCFALGLEEGMKLINSLEHTYAVFITEDYEMHYSDGFLEDIKVTNQE